MTASAINPKVNFFFDKARQWQEEYKLLRTIVLDSRLTEELKWGVPCYTFEKSNVVLIHGFKEYCAFLFVKGALMKDPNKILIQQTENVQAARQVRFTSAEQIAELEPVLKTYIREAIRVEQSGEKVPYKKSTEFVIADEFREKLDAFPALKKAFEALTPGRQRAYLLHFLSPKQAKTRAARVEKYMEHILQGKGLDD